MASALDSVAKSAEGPASSAGGNEMTKKQSNKNDDERTTETDGGMMRMKRIKGPSIYYTFLSETKVSFHGIL